MAEKTRIEMYRLEKTVCRWWECPVYGWVEKALMFHALASTMDTFDEELSDEFRFLYNMCWARRTHNGEKQLWQQMKK